MIIEPFNILFINERSYSYKGQKIDGSGINFDLLRIGPGLQPICPEPLRFQIYPEQNDKVFGYSMGVNEIIYCGKFTGKQHYPEYVNCSRFEPMAGNSGLIWEVN